MSPPFHFPLSDSWLKSESMLLLLPFIRLKQTEHEAIQRFRNYQHIYRTRLVCEMGNVVNCNASKPKPIWVFRFHLFPQFGQQGD